MVTPPAVPLTPDDGMTPLERELALASFGPETAHGTPHDVPAHAPHNPHLAHWRAHLNGLRAQSARALPLRPCGRLTRAAGLVLEAIGLRLSVGAECTIELPPGSTLPAAEAEVVGFSGDRLFLMPTTDVAGVLPGARVWPLESAPVADRKSVV